MCATVTSVGRARVLANQGNALAHLGLLDAARAKLVEARFLFEANLDHDWRDSRYARCSTRSPAARSATPPAAFETDLARQASRCRQVPGAE